MICSLKAPFFKEEHPLEEKSMAYIKIHLVEEEKSLESLSVYKSGRVIAIFTDKRIIFAKAFDEDTTDFDQACEIQFLPYKSIQRFSFIGASIPDRYKIDVTVSGELRFSFYITDTAEAMSLSQLIGKNII